MCVAWQSKFYTKSTFKNQYMSYGTSNTKHMTKLFIATEIDTVNKPNSSIECRESTCVDLFILTTKRLHKVLP